MRNLALGPDEVAGLSARNRARCNVVHANLTVLEYVL